MVGAPFGQSQAGEKKTGKKGGKGKQVVKKVNGKQDKAVASQGHAGAILCLAASEDGKYLLTGGKDKVIGVWQVESPISNEEGATDVEVKWMRGLGGHKDAVTVSKYR
jgi:ribosomal RNA-processing protein 9